jgi:hypothetical protein
LGGFTAQHGLDVVKGAVAFVIDVRAAGIVGPVRARVPASDAKVQAPRESQLVIDDDHLLVVGGPERVRAVQRELHAWMIEYATEAREQLPFQRVDHREIPTEDPDRQAGLAFERFAQGLLQGNAVRLAPRVRRQYQTCINIPAQHEDVGAGEAQRC